MRGRNGRRPYIVQEVSRSSHGVPGTIHRQIEVLATSIDHAKILGRAGRLYPTSILKAERVKNDH